MILKRYTFIQYLIICFVFFVSLFVASLYTDGDQILYKFFYETAQYVNLREIILVQPALLSSREYTYGFLVWIFAHIGISHIVFIAFFNASLVYVLFNLFKKWNVHILIVISFVLTNFYLFVLYFAAERLKFAVLFFILALLNTYSMKKTIFYSFLSVTSHAQMFVLYGAIFIGKLKVIFSLISKWQFLWLFMVAIGIFFLMQNQILLKLSSYSDKGGLYSFYKSTIFMFLALYYAKNKTEALMMYIVLFIVISFVGDIRVNIFSYFIFLYYGLHVNRGINAGIIITSLYYGVKSVFFLYNIVMYGNGFANLH